MPDRLQQKGLFGAVVLDERLISLGLLVVTIINIIVVGGVLLVRAPLAGWAV